MAGISDKFNGSKTKLIVGTAFADVATAGLGDVANTATYTSIAKIIELGTISNEANVIDVPEFGQDYAGKLVGQLNAGTIDSTVAWNPGDTNHIALKDAVTNKTKKGFIIRWFTGSYGTAGTVIVAGRDYYVATITGAPNFSAWGGPAAAVVGDVFTATSASADTSAAGTVQEASADFVAFNGYVSSFGIETSIDDAVKASASIAIDGAITFFA